MSKIHYYKGIARKEGRYAASFSIDSTPQANKMQAYLSTGLLDLSSYQKLSFWINLSAAIPVNRLNITLCSDTAGAVPVDTFDIPAIPTVGLVPLTLERNGGGNLGSNIQSIAINTGSSVLGSLVVYLDNIMACTSNGINLQSLISKNSLEQGGDEGWYPIQSINKNVVLLVYQKCLLELLKQYQNIMLY